MRSRRVRTSTAVAKAKGLIPLERGMKNQEHHAGRYRPHGSRFTSISHIGGRDLFGIPVTIATSAATFFPSCGQIYAMTDL
jgi:hypothetical protein